MKPKIRKRFLVYPRFQLLLIGFQLGVILGIVVPVLLAIHVTFRDLQNIAINAGLPQGHAFFRLVSMEKQHLLSRLTLPMVLGVLASAIVTVVISDRLAGPIVRLRGIFRRMSETGEPEKVQFRSEDFFGDLPPIINSAIEKLTRSRG